MREGRWLTDSVLDHEQEAVQLAKKYLSAGTVQGARVIYERELGGGDTTERTVFEEMGEVKDNRPVTISTIHEAAWCETADQVFELPGRMVITRLLRTYLSRNTIIASELLYDFRVLSRLQNHDSNIYPAAVDRVATLQAAENEDLDIRTRANDLYAMIDEVGRRARRAEGEKMMRGAGLGDLAKARELARKASFEPAEQAYLVRASVGRALSGQRSWLGKLEMLLQAVSADLPADDLAMIDEFMADCLGIGEVIQDILGNRANLSSALMGLIDLIEGRDPAEQQIESETLQVLAQLFAERRVPACAEVVLDRVCREVQGGQPLARNDPSKEHEAYEDLCRRVATHKGLTGHTRMAVALTRRYNSRLKEGGDTGWRSSIVGVCGMMREGARRLHYLTALSHANEVEPYLPLVQTMIVDDMKRLRTVDDIVGKMPPTEKLATITSIQRAVMAGEKLPKALTERAFSHFDEVLLRYVETAKLIERLDRPSDSLRLRAERLVSFCGSGVLLEGKALNAARQRVLDYLRRPDFMVEFMADVPKDRQDAAVRQFYTRLSKAGFKL
jgi:hypothetical protein